MCIPYKKYELITPHRIFPPTQNTRARARAHTHARTQVHIQNHVFFTVCEHQLMNYRNEKSRKDI